MTHRANGFATCSAAMAAVLLLTAIAIGPALVIGASALAAEEQASTVIADITYGEGGTKQTVSNAQHELLAEVWRDKTGIVREQFEADGGGAEYWGFFFGEGGSTSDWRGSAIAIKPMERPSGRWEMWVYGPGNTTLKEYSYLSREELEREFAYWHIQMRSWVNGFLSPAQPSAVPAPAPG
jgi:hypothetical protein